MRQLIPKAQAQEQDNLVKDINVGRDLTFAPVQNIIETQIIQSSLEAVTQRKLNINSPYQGLKRFNVKDRDRFFGRDKLIARLFDAVNRSSLSLVLGASGSGKSSLVRAGLIPELKKSMESQRFYDFIFTPNHDPFDSLYRCLLSEEKDYSFSKLEAGIALESKADTLTKAIKNLKKEEERWLIFIDQFEELFTICADVDKRKKFIASLVQVVRSGNSSVKLVLAMRSDFLEQFSFYSDLGVIANQNNIHLVTEMYPDDLRQAIEQPAAKHGVVFEEGLVKQIIEEIEGQKGYLPLLQYTLNLLWETECKTHKADGIPSIEDRVLSKKSYTALEGVRGALQKQINEIYSKLKQDEQDATKQIFLKLVNIVNTDSGSKVVSRRAYRHEFVSESVENLLNRFIDEKLLVSNSEYSIQEELQVSNNKYLKQSATVEIAHEILLSSWDILKRWLEQEKEAIILKNWLAGETNRWEKIRFKDESKAQDELLKGSRLDQVVELRHKDAFKNIGGLSKQEEEFINFSVDRRDRLRREKKDRRRRGIAGVSVVALTIIMALGVTAWKRSQQAEINSAKANYYSLGLSRIVNHDNQGATEEFNQLVYLDPNDAQAYYSRGLALYQQNDSQGALKDFNHALQLNPNYAPAYYGLGIVHGFSLRDKKGALDDYNHALQLDPNDSYAYNNRGIVRDDLRDKQGALDDYNHALQLDPNHAKAYNNRGNVRRELGDKKGALDDYNHALRLDPKYALAYNNRGNVRRELGDKKGALEDYNQAVRLDPKYALAYNNRQRVLRELRHK